METKLAARYHIKIPEGPRDLRRLPMLPRRGPLTLPELLAFAAVAVPVLAALRFPTSAIDLAYLLRAGQVMIDTGTLLRHDFFTFTAFGDPWLNQQWGAEILFALLFRWGNWSALFLLRAILVALIFFFVYRSARASGASIRFAAWLTLGSFVLSLDVPLRPQLIGMVLFASTVWIVAARSRRPYLMWAIPVIVAVWANVHGSFFLVTIPLLVAWLEDRRQGVAGANRSVLVGLIAILAASLNPFGLEIWRYVLEISANPVISSLVREWQPPTIRGVEGVLFFLSALAVAGFLVFGRRTPVWPPVLGLGLVFVLGLAAVRNGYWWALAGPAFLAQATCDPVPPERVRSRPVAEGVESPGLRWLPSIIAVVLAVLIVAYLPLWRRSFTSNSNESLMSGALVSHAPARITDRVESLLPRGQRLFVPQMWGSWFEFALPTQFVFVDSRIELFPAPVWREYFLVSNGEVGWEEVLARWRVRTVVASRTQQARLIPLLRADARWREVFDDPAGVVFVRR